jgi:hypothetical protein
LTSTSLIHPSDHIRLNIGGTYFDTCRSTISSSPMLNTYINECSKNIEVDGHRVMMEAMSKIMC